MTGTGRGGMTWQAQRNGASGRFEGAALIAGEFAHVRMSWSGGRIVDITRSGPSLDEARLRQTGQAFAVPGFIDCHVHGGMGRDVMEGAGAAAHVAKAHARFGTTAWLATTLTAPTADLAHALQGVRQAMDSPAPGAAHVLGVHLEGPYISPKKLGAQPDFVRNGSAQEIEDLHAIAPIRVITLAPELPGHAELIDGLVARGFKVQLGHSNASYEQAAAALARGASGVTHVFNAMSGLHHREPGVVGAALAHASHAEIIADIIHVHPGAIRVALRCVPELFCVTDATAATGMPDGQFALGSQTVHKCLGAVRLADGTLAGSALTMDQAFRNLVQSLGLSWSRASALTSTRAAKYLGLADRGQLAVGAWADVAVFNPDLSLRHVLAAGHDVEGVA